MCPNLRVTPADLGTTDVPHLLNRLQALGGDLTVVEDMAKALLPAAEHGMTLSSQLITPLGSIHEPAPNTRGRQEDAVELKLLCAVALGWLTCWHFPGNEDVEIELTAEGRLVLRDVYENAANRLAHTAPSVCPGCHQCRLADHEEDDFPW